MSLKKIELTSIASIRVNLYKAIFLPRPQQKLDVRRSEVFQSTDGIDHQFPGRIAFEVSVRSTVCDGFVTRDPDGVVVPGIVMYIGQVVKIG